MNKSVHAACVKAAFFGGTLFGCLASLTGAIDGPVRVDGGLIAGITGRSPDVRVFEGVPYAAPPVGALRWRAPQPVISWEGVRKADAFGPSAMQIRLDPRNFFYAGRHPISEDCLYLNVWTAADSPAERRPVLLWIHEGGFQWGEGTREAVNGEALSRKGVVVVTINYRLNVFGFFAHPELSRETPGGVSGNYGLLDVIAAIKWTRRNIGAFGGDATRITLFGESAGSNAVSGLAASPLVAGDIAGAIGESGVMMGIPTLSEEERNGVEFARLANAARVEDLRRMSAERLLDAFSRFNSDITMEAVIDGWVMSYDALTAESKGLGQKIPILTGSNADEGTDGITAVSAREYIDQCRKRSGDRADRYLTVYPAASEAGAATSQFMAIRDKLVWAHTRWAELHARNGHRAYLYYFTHAPPRPPNALFNYAGGKLPDRVGAFHTGEICYVFDSLALVDRPWTSYDHNLADIISSYWANFAAHGDPNGKGLPRWPAFGSGANPVMELGDHVRSIPRVLSKAKADLWSAEFLRAGGR